MLQIRHDTNQHDGDPRVYRWTDLQGNALFLLDVRILHWLMQPMPRLQLPNGGNVQRNCLLVLIVRIRHGFVQLLSWLHVDGNGHL